MGLNVVGLMAMGAVDWSEDQLATTYSDLVDLGHKLNLHEFSIGMSNDWKVALRSGSTLLRVGSLLFGPRM